MKYLSILGSTGSIGDNVLDIVRQFPDRYQAVALAAGTNVNKLIEQIAEFRPEVVSLRDVPAARILQERLPKGYSPKIVCDTSGHIEVATFPKAHTTISAMVGAVGLEPTLAAIAAGKDIGLANKETLVMAGRIVMEAVHRYGVRLLPIDSEHSAIFQALEAGRKEDVKKIILTASGGPFRGMTQDALQTVTPQDALRHPNWSMGQKISIDSATLMNKGLEVIEARWLFDVAIDDIEVLVHPQSIIHSMVEYQDGSLVAQLGIPDMRIPIAYALAYPERLPLSLPSLTLAQCSALEFLEPDHATFPSLKLACAAGRQGGVLPAVLNAANEIAVAAFLANKITFSQIFETVVRTMDIVNQGEETDLQAILHADQEARKTAEQLIVYRL